MRPGCRPRHHKTPTSKAEAAAAGHIPPSLAVWVPVALDPGDRVRLQIGAQLAIYLAAPGYGEMFSALGFPNLSSVPAPARRDSSSLSRSRLNCLSTSARWALRTKWPGGSLPI
jgi:hypothetical protein